MYTLISAMVLDKAINSQWKVLDISTIPVKTLFIDFNSVVITVGSVFLNKNIYVDIFTLKNDYLNYTGTVQSLLTSLGNKSLLTLPTLPNSNIKYAKYADAFSVGYKLNTTLIGAANVNQLTTSQLKDAVITRPNTTTNLQMLHDYCMVSVNGFFHRTDSDGINAYLYDAGTTVKKSNSNTVGIWSFLDIGKIVKQPIALTNIFNQGLNSTLYERTYIKIGQDVSKKTVMLVLGGYLILPETNIFWQTANDTYAINFGMLQLLERFYESQNYIDLSSLGIGVDPANVSTINVATFLSDAVLKKYLTLSQSFIVILDSPNIFINKMPVKNNTTPGYYTSFQEPTGALFVGYGKVGEYWKANENGYWSMTVHDSIMRRYLFSNTPLDMQVNVTPMLVPSDPYVNSNATMLQIGSYI